ncbi:MAG: hypothetical protein HOQ05_08600 [Corynebacteriales bacterium]|nr:hypothetical protein [Mycobacteriales bacterium]
MPKQSKKISAEDRLAKATIIGSASLEVRTTPHVETHQISIDAHERVLAALRLSIEDGHLQLTIPTANELTRGATWKAEVAKRTAELKSEGMVLFPQRRAQHRLRKEIKQALAEPATITAKFPHQTELTAHVGGPISTEGAFTDLDLSTSDGSITSSGDYQTANLTTDNGFIALDAIPPGAVVEATTKQGNIHTQLIGGMAKLTLNARGEVTTGNVSWGATVEVQATEAIEMHRLAPRSSVQARTLNGRAKFGNIDEGAYLDAKTADGEIKVGRIGTDAKAHLEAGKGLITVGRSAAGAFVQAATGHGTVKLSDVAATAYIDARTSFGDVTLTSVLGGGWVEAKHGDVSFTMASPFEQLTLSALSTGHEVRGSVVGGREVQNRVNVHAGTDKVSRSLG